MASAEVPAEQWNRSFGGNNEDNAWCVQQTSDGGYLITTTISNQSNSYNLWLIKTDEHGQEQWNKTLGGPIDNSAISISMTSDNGYLLAGKYTESYSFGTDSTAFILKTDSEGNQEWVKVFSNCTLYSVQQTSDGGYIAVGVKNGNAWLVKLAGNGNTESEGSKDSESESRGNIESENAPDSFFDQIRYYICDIFRGIFQ